MGIAKNKKPSAATELRRHAEERLRVKTAELHPPRTEEATQRLLHELEVHQIELEMQNAELHRTREELELSSNKYLELYDFAPIGYFTIDMHGLIEEVNLTGANLLGIERRLLLKRSFISFIAETADRDILSKCHEEVFKKQGNQTCEIRLKRKNGTTFYAQVQSTASENIDVKAGHIYTTITDITGRKRAEEALQKTYDGLEEQVAERTSQLVASNTLLKQEIAKRKIVGEKLNESRERLRNLTNHLQQIRERERSYLSRELHDELGQVLTGLKMDIRWVERRMPEDYALIAERFKSMLMLIDNAILSVQRLSTALRPPVLDDFGLNEAIELVLTDFEKRTSIACEFVSTLPHTALDRKVSTEVFRIFQEALTNVARHASAQRVAITMQHTVDKLTMEIRDDGRGITKQEMADPVSIGLTGMRERVYALEGTLEIMGVQGKGTTVALSIPLCKEKKRRRPKKTAKEV